MNLLAKLNTSKTIFFHMSLMNGTSLIQTFLVLEIIIFCVYIVEIYKTCWDESLQYRSSNQRCSIIKGEENTCARVSFLIKLVARQRLWHRCLPVSFAKFLRTPFFGIKNLARLRLGYRHLREHKFRHDFNATLNPPSSSSIEAETTTHYFLHCHLYNSNRAPFWMT